MNIATVNKLIQEGRYKEAADELSTAPDFAVTDPSDLYSYLVPWQYKAKEHFLAITLDAQCQVINIHEISSGLVNQCLSHPREIFRAAVLDSAVFVIIAHNHPSGGMEFTEEDIELTSEMIKAGEVMKIPVLDHILITKEGFLSFLKEGEKENG